LQLSFTEHLWLLRKCEYIEQDFKILNPILEQYYILSLAQLSLSFSFAFPHFLFLINQAGRSKELRTERKQDIQKGSILKKQNLLIG
jgi:hypothetical protein